MFDSYNGDFDIQKKHINNRGIPVISSGELNSGVIGKTDIQAKIFPKRTITVDMFGNVYYRDFQYKMVTHARVFSLNGEIIKNEKIGLYLTTALKFLNRKFSYNNMCSWSKIYNEKILLPTINNEVAYNFIETYISELEEERISELEEERISELTAYLKVSGLDNYELSNKEKEVVEKTNNGNICFKKIKIKELFEITTGRDVIIGTTESGNIPLISNRNNNNGITKYIKELNNRNLFDYKTTLALADRGLFYATTQTEKFYIGTRVKALTFKEGETTEKIRLFFTTSINKLQELFKEYLVNATNKLPDLEIALPITTTDSIDYDFMETYITAQEKLAIKDVVIWKDKVISKTKEII